MSDVSKVPNTVLLIKDQRAYRRCSGCVTLYCTMNNWSKAMYVGGVKSGVCGFYTTLHTKYCYSCRRCQRCIVLCIKWPLTPARRKGYLLQYSIWKAFCLGGLVVHHQSIWGGSFVNFLGLVKLQGWLQQDIQPILKTKGPLSTPVILTYLQTKLHPPYPNQTACLNLDPKSVFNAWRKCPLESAGSVLCKVGSHEQVD